MLALIVLMGLTVPAYGTNVTPGTGPLTPSNLPPPGDDRDHVGDSGLGGTVVVGGSVLRPGTVIPPPPPPPGGGGGGGGGLPGGWPGGPVRQAAAAEDGAEVLGYMFFRAYVVGYPDRTFRPNNPITRAEVAVMLYGLLDERESAMVPRVAFSDVHQGTWYFRAVSQLANRGVIIGYPDGTFKPHQFITRAEFSTLMVNFMDVPVTAAVSAFPDLSESHWAHGFIMAAHREGWVVGYPDGTFQPNGNLTRAEAVVIINNATRRYRFPELVAGRRTFSDVSPSHWAFTHIELAANDIHLLPHHLEALGISQQ